MIADNRAVQRFVLDALNAIEGTDEISVFSCRNTRTRKRWLRHGLYYALNLLSVRNRFTRFVPLASGRKSISRQVDFTSNYEGAWQVLPPDVVKELSGFDVILKFGMGLLRVPMRDQLPVPILSYHHGDPDRYRGRPAGFWEIADGAPVLGQMVQVIGNRLDAGEVVAYAETKVLPWSWRATLVESFRHSPLIINAAIANALSGNILSKPCLGRNCRLPSNLAVAGFTIRMAARFVRRLGYGAFFEKAWKVSTTPLASEQLPTLLEGTFPNAAQWRTLPVARGYAFYADPFFSRQGILVEALSARTGRGEIVLVADGKDRRLSDGSGHMSYPATAHIGGREYVVPETARWSPPLACTIDSGGLKTEAILRIAGEARVVDPTLFACDGRLYLFGNIQALGSNTLHLWSADSLDGEFRLHPSSPVRISPEGGRMGGALVEHGPRLVRFGQDFSRGYGDGLIAFRVEELSATAYRERPIGRIRFQDRKGPHTLNFGDGEIVFDWYRDRFTLMAGVRRLLGRRAEA